MTGGSSGGGVSAVSVLTAGGVVAVFVSAGGGLVIAEGGVVASSVESLAGGGVISAGGLSVGGVVTPVGTFGSAPGLPGGVNALEVVPPLLEWVNARNRAVPAAVPLPANHLPTLWWLLPLSGWVLDWPVTILRGATMIAAPARILAIYMWHRKELSVKERTS
jgi:hypothetical protein